MAFNYISKPFVRDYKNFLSVKKDIEKIKNVIVLKSILFTKLNYIYPILLILNLKLIIVTSTISLNISSMSTRKLFKLHGHFMFLISLNVREVFLIIIDCFRTNLRFILTV